MDARANSIGQTLLSSQPLYFANTQDSLSFSLPGCMDPWKIHSCRCISYWKSGLFPADVLDHRVPLSFPLLRISALLWKMVGSFNASWEVVAVSMQLLRLSVLADSHADPQNPHIWHKQTKHSSWGFSSTGSRSGFQRHCPGHVFGKQPGSYLTGPGGPGTERYTSNRSAQGYRESECNMWIPCIQFFSSRFHINVLIARSNRMSYTKLCCPSRTRVKINQEVMRLSAMNIDYWDFLMLLVRLSTPRYQMDLNRILRTL